MIEINSQFLVWVASGGIGGGLVAFLLKSWFQERLKTSIKHEYDVKLAAIRADIEKESNLITSLQEGYRRKNDLAHEAILKSIESLWSGIIQLRKRKPTLLTLVDVLLEDEFGKSFGEKELKSFGDITDEEIQHALSDSLNGMDENRLYTGEYLWSLFFAYRQLIGRISILVKEGREKKNVPIWWQDRICKQVISSLTTEEELQEFTSLKISKIDWLLSHIEEKYLNAANKVITGEASIDMDIELAQRIIRSVGSATEI